MALPVFVQSKGHNEVVTTSSAGPININVTFDNPVTAGNLIVVAAGVHVQGFSFADQAQNLQVTDSLITPALFPAATVIGSVYLGGCAVGLFYCISTPGGADTVTLTFDALTTGFGLGTHFACEIIAAEYSNWTAATLPGATCVNIYGAAGLSPVTLNITDSHGTTVPVVFAGNAGSSYPAGGPGTDTGLALMDLESAGSDGLWGALMTGVAYTPGLPTTAASGYSAFALETSDGVYPPTALYLWDGAVLPAALSLDCGSPPDGEVGVPYSHTFPVTGGTLPYVFSISSGSLPLGLSLDSATGTISGTPTTPNTYAFVVTVTDGASVTANCSITIIIEAIVASCNSPAAGSVGISYTHTFTVSGGTAAYVWTFVSGAFPPGLSLAASTGVLSGTPSLSGVYSFTIQVEDALSLTARVTCSISITGAFDCPCGTDAGLDLFGNPVCRVMVYDRITPHLYEVDQNVVYNRITFEIQRGVGLDGAHSSDTDPQLLLRWSDDGGNTWSPEYPIPMGKIGEYVKRVYMNQLGYAPRGGGGRVFWVRCTDTVYNSLIGAQLDFFGCAP